jgi:RNA polymerase sigma factor (sigma-70 family)
MMDKDYLYQIDIREWIERGLDADIMVPVSGNKIDKKYDIYLQSFLLPLNEVENDMENAEQLAIISDGLERLSKQDKEIFIRFYYYGERLAAISGKMGITENACKTRLSRTRKKLREYLAERGYKNEKK